MYSCSLGTQFFLLIFSPIPLVIERELSLYFIQDYATKRRLWIPAILIFLFVSISAISATVAVLGTFSIKWFFLKTKYSPFPRGKDSLREPTAIKNSVFFNNYIGKKWLPLSKFKITQIPLTFPLEMDYKRVRPWENKYHMSDGVSISKELNTWQLLSAFPFQESLFILKGLSHASQLCAQFVKDFGARLLDVALILRFYTFSLFVTVLYIFCWPWISLK